MSTAAAKTEFAKQLYILTNTQLHTHKIFFKKNMQIQDDEIILKENFS